MASKPKIGAIIQARVSSTRLPGKVLLELPYGSGITVLQQVIRRTKKAKKINKIIVATTIKKVDDIIVKIAKKEKVEFFRGSENNLLMRYYKAAKKYKLDVIVRITSDCPCIDSKNIDQLVGMHLMKRVDFTSNCVIKSFPHGIDAEVYNFKTLEKAFKNATEKYEKEGVAEYITVTKVKEFKISILKAAKELYSPDIRITLDTQEDYALLCTVFCLLKDIPDFDTKDIIHLFQKNPWLRFINSRVVNKKIFFNLKDEIKEAIKILNLQELNNASKILANELNKTER